MTYPDYLCKTHQPDQACTRLRYVFCTRMRCGRAEVRPYREIPALRDRIQLAEAGTLECEYLDYFSTFIAAAGEDRFHLVKRAV
jgi:hypothetical protein